MNRSLALLFVLVICAAPHSSKASTAIESAGTATCGQYGRAYKGDPKGADAVFMSWVQGFLSGWNVGALMQKKPSRDLSAKSIAEQERFIRDFCGNNPLLSVYEGAIKLYHSLPEVAP